MNMRDHILRAFEEQFNKWEELLASMSDAQITGPIPDSDWTIKDVIAHLMAWQQRSIARMEVALHDQEPGFPRWLPGVNPEEEDNPDHTNAWIIQAYRDQPWSKVYQGWRTGFLRFLGSSKAISEIDLLDYDRYSWMAGYSLADVILSSYVHHQEHYEKLTR